MNIEKVKGNTFCIDTGMTYIPFYKIDEQKIIMFDSGWARGEREGIEDIFRENNFKVAAIISSHSHIDHIGNNAYFKKKFNCIIAMSEPEAFICDSIINLKVYYGGQSLTDVKKHFGHMVCKTDIIISDEQDSVFICGIKFKIIHTPGHSPGHICIITPDDVLYIGDALIGYDVMNSAKMPYALMLKEDLKSKNKLYDVECSKYIVAHKGIYNDIKQLISDNIDFYKFRSKRICELINGNMTMEEILRTVIKAFHIHINSIYKYNVIERSLKSYIEYLTEEEKVKPNICDGFMKYGKVNIL